MLEHFLHNELMVHKMHSNLKILAVVFRATGAAASAKLAQAVLNLTDRDDIIGVLKPLIKKVFKTLGSDVDIVAFCNGLLQPCQVDPKKSLQQREKWAHTVVELVCQSLMLGHMCSMSCYATCCSASPVLHGMLCTIALCHTRCFACAGVESTRASHIPLQL